MIYNEQLTLTANTPLPYDCININCSRLHFLQINDIAVVTVRVTLQIGQPPVELESITGPGVFQIPSLVHQFELESTTDTTVVLTG